MTNGKPIRPHEGEALQEFADDLVNCVQTLKAMDYLSEINTQSVLAKIVDRLPTYLRNRWIREVRETRVKQSRSAGIKDLIVFVSAAAEEANDPVYCKHKDPSKFRDKGTWKNNKDRSFSVVTQPTNPVPKVHVCVMCGGNHSIFQCNEFRGLNVDSRLRFTRDKKLCFNCLQTGHRSDSCNLRRKCSVPGCDKKHTRFLHHPTASITRSVVPEEPRAVDQSATDDNPVETTSGLVEVEDRCMATGAGMTKVALPLVLVKVWSPDRTRYVDTYALLDNGSTTTFCTERLARSIGLEGKKDILTLSTLQQSGSRVETAVVSLDLTDFSEQNAVRLETVYIRQELPVKPQNGATADDVKMWSHLQDIELHDATVDKVELLIGQDCPEALMPLEVRYGDKHSLAPFAVKTVLGWTIQGPISKSSRQRAVVNFVSKDAELQQSVERFWRLDYGGNMADDTKGMSIEDRRALSVMEDSVKKVDGHYEIQTHTSKVTR